MKSQNKNAIFNILGPIILNGISFFTMPFFTRMLGPEQYGIASVYKTWVGIFTIIMGLQVQGSIGAAVITFPEKTIKKFQSTILLFGLFFSIACFLFGCVLSDVLVQYLLLPKNVLAVMGLHSMSMFVISFAVLAFIFFKKSKYSFTVNVSVAVIDALLSIYLIMKVFNADQLYLGRIYGSAFPAIFVALILIFYFLKMGQFTFDLSYVKFCLPICVPLIFHGLSHIVLGQSDRIMLQHMMGNADAGVYSFMIVFTSVLVAVWNALNNTWVPYYYDDLKNNQIAVIEQKTKNYIRMFSIIVIVFSLWATEVIKLFSPPSFWHSIKLLPVFALSNYFTFLYSFPVNFQFFHKTTYSVATGTVLAALSNIGLNYLLIPKYGIMGAAIATLAAHVLLFVFHELIADKLIKGKYHYNLKTFLPGLIITMLAMVMGAVLEPYMVVRWGIGIVLSGYFLLDLYKRRSLF